MTADEGWYAERGCTHAHCPLGCDKPQPSLVGGRMLCMRCWVQDGIASEMIPCVPETCD